MDEYFKLNKLKKTIFDEDGEKTGYELYKLRLPEYYPNVLNSILLKFKGKQYRYTAIPIIEKPQTYYIKPIRISGNVVLNDELNVLNYYYENKDDVNEFIFYNINSNSGNEKYLNMTKTDILTYMGLVEFENKFVLGSYYSESGITKFKPLFGNRKNIIPSIFKEKLNRINENSWMLTVFYSLDPWFVDEKNRKYIGSYGLPSKYKESIDRIIELGYLFKANGKIYDVYTLFNLLDFSYSGFVRECFNLGKSLTDEKMKELFKKYQINFEEKREDFAKFYSNVISYYFSSRFEELADNIEENKAKILRYIGLDYKS